MTLIRRTNPFGELVSLRQAMDSLFKDSLVRPHGGHDSSDAASANFPRRTLIKPTAEPAAEQAS